MEALPGVHFFSPSRLHPHTGWVYEKALTIPFKSHSTKKRGVFENSLQACSSFFGTCHPCFAALPHFESGRSLAISAAWFLVRALKSRLDLKKDDHVRIKEEKRFVSAVLSSMLIDIRESCFNMF